jgi:hypothetical protein
MSKTRDRKEALTNVLVGAAINWILSLGMFNATPAFVTLTTLVFMVSSWTRSYLLRRWFRSKES